MAVLTTEEAKMLIEEMKKYVNQAILNFPTENNRKLEFEVVGEKRENEFIININKRRNNPKGCTYQGRLKRDNTVLLRIDVNPHGKHVNPGMSEEIIGSHLHIYTEEFEDKFAIPFDVSDKNLFDICMDFFERFHIVEPPHMLYQPELEGYV